MKKRTKLLLMISFALLLFVLVLFVIRSTTSFPETALVSRSIKNSDMSSESFQLCSDPQFSFYKFCVSRDQSKGNELFVYRQTRSFLSEHNFDRPRYREELHVSATDQPVGILSTGLFYQQDLTEKYDALIYYSNNESKISECRYVFILENGQQTDLAEQKKEINPNYGFVIALPDHSFSFDPSVQRIIQKVSFYDQEGNLVFEDDRTKDSILQFFSNASDET